MSAIAASNQPQFQPNRFLTALVEALTKSMVVRLTSPSAPANKKHPRIGRVLKSLRARCGRDSLFCAPRRARADAGLFEVITQGPARSDQSAPSRAETHSYHHAFDPMASFPMLKSAGLNQKLLDRML